MSDRMVEIIGRALAAEEGYAYDPVPYDQRAVAALVAMRQFTADMERRGMAAMADGGSFERVWNAALNGAMK